MVTGKDKGKRGTVSQITGDRVFVSGINLVKKHTKPNPNAGQPGGIIEKEAAIHISNIAIFNPETNAADRIAIQVEEDGSRKRVFKSNGQVIE